MISVYGDQRVLSGTQKVVWKVSSLTVSVPLKFLFFQAEDGIRVAQEARGLGDVYKRQCPGRSSTPAPSRRPSPGPQRARRPSGCWSVSYTHLTLPTIYSV
mgnify:CR=1 FL=1